MKVGEVKVARRVWDIIVLTNRYGNKFVIAKSRTIYDTVLEVHLERMFDGVAIAHEINHNILDDYELSMVRQSLLHYRKEYVENVTERKETLKPNFNRKGDY